MNLRPILPKLRLLKNRKSKPQFRLATCLSGLGKAIVVLAVVAPLGFSTTPTSEAQEPSGLQFAMAMEQMLIDAIAKAENSVVAIARVRSEGLAGGGAREPTDPDFVPDEFGSGVVVDADGLILTNAHVLGFDPKKLRRDDDYYVWLKKRPYRATVHAVDGERDLAILKIKAPTKLTAITMGDADKLKKGNIVIALGNPYATARDGEATASWGIVANLSRRAPRRKTVSAEREKYALADYGTLIQCDARLNLGSSGGALLNTKGEMVGLTTSLAALDGYEKAGGFAIPMDASTLKAIEQLKKGRIPESGFLGLAPSNLPPAALRQGALGITVDTVVPGTPASKSGLLEGDVVTHIEDEPVYNKSTFIRDISKRSPDSKVTLRVKRTVFTRTEPLTFDLKVELAKKYVDATRPSFGVAPQPSWRGLVVDYSTALPIDVYMHRDEWIDPRGCVTLPDVEIDSPAWKAGARPWMFVTHVNGQPVKKPKEFFAAVAGLTGDVKLKVTSGQTLMVPEKVADR